MVRRSLLPALLALASLTAPAAAHAQTGGAETGGTPTGGAQAPEPGAIALDPNAGATLGRLARLTGSAPAGQAVAVERIDSKTGAWARVADATAGTDGRFTARWRPTEAGRQRMRAVAADEASASSAPNPPAVSPEVAVTVYRRALATWYGPGFYGRKTACGLRMSPTLLGVAHKRLPCGTQVAVRYGDRSIVVPVIDRGPFPPGRHYDLTAAAAGLLGFKTMDHIGAVALRGEPLFATPAQAPPSR